jgi:hypothetical protein
MTSFLLLLPLVDRRLLRGNDPELASYPRIEERERGAGGLN